MKRNGFLAVLTFCIALIVAMVACSGRGQTSERSGCGGCGLGCAACTACVAAGCALSCARGLFDITQDTVQTAYSGVDYN